MSSFFSGSGFNNLSSLLGYRQAGAPRQTTRTVREFVAPTGPAVAGPFGTGGYLERQEKVTEPAPPNSLERVLRQSGPSGELLLRASEFDRTRLQTAEDARFGELQRVLGRAESAFTGGAERQRQIGEEGRQGALDLALRQRTEFEDAQTRLESEFRDTSAQQGQIMALGLRRRRDTEVQAIRDNPDLSPEERDLRIGQVNQATNEQVTATLADLGARFNETLAGLRTQGQAGRLQSQAGESALFQFGEQFRAAGALAATQLETQGYFELASLLESSPVVSALTGITQLIALAESGRIDDIGIGPTVTGGPSQGLRMGFDSERTAPSGQRRGSSSTENSREEARKEKAKEEAANNSGENKPKEPVYIS